MRLFFIFPLIIFFIVAVTIITIVIKSIRFTSKVGKNISQTIFDKTDPNKNDNKSENLYEDEEISVRLKQDQYDTKHKSYTVCKYCGCKNKKNVFRCSSCNAPLNE